MKFIEKYRKISKKNNSLLCVGLDSDILKIPSFLKENYENPIWEFNKRIIDATHKYVAAYKLNLAFYISDGNRGLSALKKTISYIPSDIPIILDVKIGDIGNTMTQYAKAYFEEFNVDAITVNPLMGFDVIEPLLKYQDKYIFILVLTSNKSSNDFLNFEDKNEQKLYIRICQKIKEWDIDNIGIVVGATNDEEVKEIRKFLPDTVFLIPGIGAQGGDLNIVMQNAVGKNEPNILINSSRGIIFASKDKDSKDFAKDAGLTANKLNNRINSNI
ncbi:MAG: orotidine-5'-phosphate decarboxylase [Candidatus Cloacimonadota bacterium]|nr:orotidine-5'-phosphate decarboxylase [Candidatus Cloacimonadota bacterium]